MNNSRTYYKYIDVRLPAVLGSMLCGSLITVIFWGLIKPDAIAPRLVGDTKVSEYSDFLSLTLTALAVMLAILTLFIGILAIWGYTQIKRTVVKRANDEANRIIKQGLKPEGDLSVLVVKSLEKDGPLYNLVLQQIGRKGELFEALKEEAFAGIAQWESAGFYDPEEPVEEEEDEA